MSLPENSTIAEAVQRSKSEKQCPTAGELDPVNQAIAAPLPSRAIAAFIDYLVLQALLIPSLALLGSSDYAFLLACAISVFYFGIGNSLVTSGRTLGKRTFGLFVVNVNDGSLLSIKQSSLRCLFQIVFPILLIELPPLFFREHSTAGSPFLLESQMLFVLIYTIWNASLVLVAKQQRAGHDFLAQSIVLQGETGADLQPKLPSQRQKAFHPIQCTTSFALGGLLWWLSVSQLPAVDAIHRIRYSLEHDFALRIISIQADATTIYLQLLQIPSEEKISAEMLAHTLCQELQTRNKLSSNTTLLRIEILAMFEEKREKTPNIAEFRLSPSTCRPIDKNGDV